MKINEPPGIPLKSPSPEKKRIESDQIPRDTFEKSTGSDRGVPRREEINELEKRTFDGDSIKTDWGYGENENAYNTIILKAISDKWGAYEPALPPLILKATVARESSFNPSAVSPTGFVGLLQLGRREALSEGLSLEPFDERLIPEKNVPAGVSVFKKKHKIVSDPLSQYPEESWAKSVAAFYKENGNPDDLQKWFLSLGAYNGGGGTILRAMDYALKDDRDPRVWNNLLDPQEIPAKSPLYRAIVDVFGEKFAQSKYYEMGRYPIKILKLAGVIGPDEAPEILPPDWESHGDISHPAPDWKTLIQAIKDHTLQSDKDLDDPLPAMSRPGTSKVVDEGRDSLLISPETGRLFGHREINQKLFDESGNWIDTTTSVAADQFAGLEKSHQDEFLNATGAKPEEITPGEQAIMLLTPDENWDSIDAPKPDVKYRQIDFSAIGEVKIEPKWIVMHYTGGVNDKAEGVWNWFNQKKGKPSTQFIIGKDGTVLQTMPETQKCSGTLHFNDESVQIEVCGNFRLQKETDEEFNKAVDLVRYLQKQYRIPDTHIISHRQVDNNTGHPGRKPDPGFRFMNRLYDALR